MNIRRGLVSTITALLAIGLLGGCSTSGSATSKAKFCQDNATLDKATQVDSEAQFLAAIKAHQATIDDFAKTAPSDIKADAQAQVSAVEAAIKANKIDQAAVPALDAGGKRIDAYCGQNSDGTPIGSRTPTTG